MRAIGFLAGVCVTVAAFLLVVHTVEHQPADPVAENPSASAQDERSRRITAGAGPVDIGPAANGAADAVPAPKGAGTADPEIQQSGNAFTSEPAPQRDVQATAPADATNREASSEAGSFLFWSPFRSAWAAEGFARRLTSATQVPVEMVDAGRGEYRVAFRYRDDTERLARISRIETITGLELE
jgi:hypothetical protein